MRNPEWTTRKIAYQVKNLITNNGQIEVRPPWGVSYDLVDYMEGHFRRLHNELKLKPGRDGYSEAEVVAMLHALVIDSERSISLRGRRLRHIQFNYDIAQKTAERLGLGEQFDSFEE